jgi:hypothetical protein
MYNRAPHLLVEDIIDSTNNILIYNENLTFEVFIKHGENLGCFSHAKTCVSTPNSKEPYT